MIDLPFALPTIVASLTLLALYGNESPVGIDIAATRAAVVVALLFVTLPFVVRAVQPLLIEMDREMEEAAASLGASGFTIFRRIIFPNLLPGLAAGVALAFARALGEFGSVLLFAGGLPQTMVSSVFIRQQIESGNDIGASAVSVVLLARGAADAGRDHLGPALGQPPRTQQRRRADRDADERRGLHRGGRTTMRTASSDAQPLGAAHPRARLPDPAPARALVMIFYKTFEHGLAPPIDAITSPDGLHALKLTLLMVAIAVPLNTIFGIGCALLLVRHKCEGQRR